MMEDKDSRRAAIETWANERIGRPLAWAPASADASFRRYFRARADDGDCDGEDGPGSWIAMDAPPEREDNAAFVKIAGCMADAGLNVPQVFEHDVERGFLLLSDLGTRTYLDVLDADTADALFGSAIGALLDWQQASRPDVLPVYDRATLAAEMDLFCDWYLARHLGHAPSATQRADIESAFEYILDNVCAQSRVFVHRDYMPRNLMISHPLPGVLDFQDARYGPVTYDVACLFRDAFVSWPDRRIDGWVGHYWDAALARGIPVATDWSQFCRDVELMSAQRHLKVLGIFARIAYRDGKPRYLEDAPRFRSYLKPVVERHEALSPLAPLLD